MRISPQLDAARPLPLYRQLANYLSELIIQGSLSPGERLPATRELAGQLGVNRTTVSAAYELLMTEGRISGQVGRGSFVAKRLYGKENLWEQLIVKRPGGSLSSASAFYHAATPISFAASRPPEELFPLKEFRRSAEEVLEGGDLHEILQLGSSSGYEPLRQYLLDQSRTEGVLGEQDDLLITNGCQQALDLLCRVLVRPGARVAIEDPVYPGLKNVLRLSGAELCGLPVGEAGADPEALRSSACPIAVLTPNFQNPTGSTIPLTERRAIARAVEDRSLALIENDIYSALRYDGDDVPSVKRLAPDAGTVLLRSFSKLAFPGLRLGWVIGPRPLISALRETKQLTDLHSDQFSQAVMLRFAQSGRLRAHQANMLDAGCERLRAALESATQWFSSHARWTRPSGGLNMWVTFGAGIDTGALLAEVQREGVGYLPGHLFAVERQFPHSLRLSFGSVRPEQIRAGFEVIGRVFGRAREARFSAERDRTPALV